MTVRLTVDERAWRANVADVAAAEPTLMPVVKGNGYGFGRPTLMPHAAALSPDVAVGTVYEATDVPPGVTPVVLTPTLRVPAGLPASCVLTVGSPAHVEALVRASWRGRVAVKLGSSMRRYGALPPGSPRAATADLTDLLDRCERAGLDVTAASIHLPLAGDDAARQQDVADWLPHLPAGLPLWLSHLGAGALAAIRSEAAPRPVRLRVGTRLWHGDKSMLHLGADVLDVRPIGAGTVAGYRSAPAPSDGHLVLVGAGSAHGVAPLDGGRSPFHHDRRRLALLEGPHMHTSMLFVPADEAPPATGDWLDLQRPLITTTADEVCWV